MALAPLDVWARLIWRARGFHWKYWPRLTVGLATSTYGTLVTLPERLTLSLVLRSVRRRSSTRLAPKGGTILITGYYRSGTTHLQNLLACHPGICTPRWGPCLAPQGFVLSWGLLRLVLIAFLTTRRPQDDMSFGPTWPGEDDFALCNWGLASSLTGRITLPSQYAQWARWDGLNNLSPTELERWRRVQHGFLWKMSVLAGRRTLLLKTPAHTMRLEALQRMLGASGLRIVHIRRDPAAVVRSNVAMLLRLQQMYGLQDGPSESELTEHVLSEYNEFEARFDEARRTLGNAVTVTELTMEDLRDAPRAEVARICTELGLAADPVFDRRVGRYLSETAGYRANAHASWSPEQVAHVKTKTRSIALRHAHSRRRTPKELEPDPPARGRITSGLAAGMLTAAVCGCAWTAIGVALHNRNDWLVWPVGIAIGMATRLGVRRGRWECGVGAGALTLLVMFAVAIPNTRWIYYGKVADVPWADLWATTRLELTAGLTLLYAFMGCMSALRIAGDEGPSAPGRGW